MIVIYVPGFLETSLAFDQAGADVYFPDAAAIVSNPPLVSALSLDGVTPLPPFGKQLYPIQALGYEPMRTILAQQLPPDTAFFPFPWDWRTDIQLAALNLAAFIQRFATSDNPVSLVCHSAGGLLAVLALADLLQQGKRNLVERVVALGTPFQGSYVAIIALNPTTAPGALGLFSLAALSIAPALALFTGLVASNLLFSWPAFTQLFPKVGGQDALGDPQRVRLYDPATFPDVAPPLASARLAAASSFAVSLEAAVLQFTGRGVLVELYGDKASTPGQIAQSSSAVPPGPVLFFDDGDGVVPFTSASLPTDLRYATQVSHGALCTTYALTGTIAEVLRASPASSAGGDFFEVSVEEVTMLPVTTLSLLTFLNSTFYQRGLFTVVGFDNNVITSPFVFTMDRSRRRAVKFAREIFPLVGCVYIFENGAWFLVQDKRLPVNFT